MSKSVLGITEKLNSVSSSFCLAKWTQVTMHLQTGMTHSCHHPTAHKIPLAELKESPAALHNTAFKKEQRRKMLTGERPKECQYCWNMEDLNPAPTSDRILKSNEDWSIIDFDKIKKLDFNENINPRYLEVSFGNECNFKCAYCSPLSSSSILQEYQKHGHYKEIPYDSLDTLRKKDIFPISKTEENPYLTAFWEWWPEIKHDLRVFRVTGGEPLMNFATFKLLDYICNEKLPHLSLAINTNFGVNEKILTQFIDVTKRIVEEKKVSSLEIYTSIDTYGEQAEYIRYGLNYSQFFTNIKKFLTEVPEVKLVFMVTYNALSVVQFTKLLEDIVKLKSEFKTSDSNTTRVLIDISYLKSPAIFSCQILPDSFLTYFEQSVEFMKKSYLHNSETFAFSAFEVSKMERILKWFKALPKDETPYLRNEQLCFDSFLTEYDSRKGTNFAKTFPEYKLFRKHLRFKRLIAKIEYMEKLDNE